MINNSFRKINAGVLWVAISCAVAITLPVALQADDVEDNDRGTGAVYTMTNDPHANAVLAFHRSATGALTPAGRFFTGGRGTGGKEPDFGLGNARALVLDDDKRLLFVVNPGSDTLSVFQVRDDGLRLVDRHGSMGHQPISVTVSGHLVYVLNAGGNDGQSDNISGFTVTQSGDLTPLSDSTRPLSAAVTGPAQIRFNRSGSMLVVTERNTNRIDTYAIGSGGRAIGPVVNASDAETPFGFDFSSWNGLFVADDFNDAAGAGAMSSFLLKNDGKLQLVSSNVQAGKSGACWVLVTANNRFAYLANTVSSAISVYTIDPATAKIAFRNSFASPTNPTDMDFSRDGHFLYVLNPDQTGNNPGITVYRINAADGSLTPLPGVSGLPPGIDGIAAR